MRCTAATCTLTFPDLQWTTATFLELCANHSSISAQKGFINSKGGAFHSSKGNKATVCGKINGYDNFFIVHAHVLQSISIWMEMTIRVLWVTSHGFLKYQMFWQLTAAFNSSSFQSVCAKCVRVSRAHMLYTDHPINWTGRLVWLTPVPIPPDDASSNPEWSTHTLTTWQQNYVHCPHHARAQND